MPGTKELITAPAVDARARRRNRAVSQGLTGANATARTPLPAIARARPTAFDLTGLRDGGGRRAMAAGDNEVVPTIGTASEAVFYNTERNRTNRIIVSCDIRDMGVDVVQSYEVAMHRVGGGGEDPDRVAQEASDEMVDFRRSAIEVLRRSYQPLVDAAIEAAKQRGADPAIEANERHRAAALAHDLEAERAPSFLMGGDEITLSLHEGMRPYVPRLAATLMDSGGIRARVAISTTGSDPDAVGRHIRAQQRADPAHSVLKSLEAAQRDLQLTLAEITDPEIRRRATHLVRRLGLRQLYAEHEDAGIALHRSDIGPIVDVDRLRGCIAELTRRLRGWRTSSGVQ